MFTRKQMLYYSIHPSSKNQLQSSVLRLSEAFILQQPTAYNECSLVPSKRQQAAVEVHPQRAFNSSHTKIAQAEEVQWQKLSKLNQQPANNNDKLVGLTSSPYSLLLLLRSTV